MVASTALVYWQSDLAHSLDGLEQIHRSASIPRGSAGWSVGQFNGQLFIALVARFHEYCRTLHDGSLDWLREHSAVARHLADLAARNRKLDRHNPTMDVVGEDFGRFGVRMDETLRAQGDGAERIGMLNACVRLRNAAAHGSATVAAPNAAPLTLESYRTHREALDGLAVDMDRIVAHHLGALTGQQAPW